MASADRRVTQVGLLLMVPPNELCQQSDAAHRGVPSGHHSGLRVRILATLVVLSKSRMGVLLMVPSAQVGVLATLRLVVLSTRTWYTRIARDCGWVVVQAHRPCLRVGILLVVPSAHRP